MHVRIRRVLATAAAGVLLTAGSVGPAYADDVSNNLDGTIDAVAEVMALNLGEDDGRTTLYVAPVNGDGKNGCNLTGSTTLGIEVTSDNAAVATVSPSSVTFTSCGDTEQLTVHAVATGTAKISVAQTSNNTGGTFNLAPATFTVTVAARAPANMAPQVAVDGVSEGTSYEKGTALAPTCTATDAEDGARSFPATVTGTLDPDGLGSQTASCAYTDSGGAEASASKTYSIVDASAPAVGYTLSPSDPDGADGWYTGTVTLTWQVSDPQSPISLQRTGCVDQIINADQVSTRYSCSATSSGGSSGPVHVELKRDGNGPAVEYTGAGGLLGDNGWYVSPVTATFGASDEFSGVAGSSTKSVTSTADGGAVVLHSPTFDDNAGNTATAGAARSPALKIDTVGPSVGDPVLSGTRGSNDWYTSAVTASFTASDTTSGVVGDATKTVASGATQGELVLSSPTFRDVAGNVTAAGAKSTTVKVDSVQPSVELVDGPEDGGSSYFGDVPAAPTCTAGDSTSGLAGACTITGYSTAVGTHTVTATAYDVAGNKSTSTSTYTVRAWTMNGYYKPVDMGDVLNTVKNGSTVPLKFEVFAGPAELTSTSAIDARFTVQGITCPGASTPTDSIEITTTGGTSFRYDTTGGQFIQNWQTPKKAGACYEVVTTLADGSSISAKFLLK